jgi:hypothetical protein
MEAATGVGRTRLSEMEADPAPNPTLSVLLALQRALELDTLEALIGDLPSTNTRNRYERRDRETG